MSILYKLKRKLNKNPFLWKHLFNAKASSKFDSKQVPSHLKPILSELREFGMIKSNVDTIFDNTNPFDEIYNCFLETENAHQELINKFRIDANDVSIGSKSFMLFLLGTNPKFDIKSIPNKFATLPEVKALANGYFEMESVLKYYNFWHSFPTSTPARESQLWHRDREDLQIFKFFLYFNDVNLGAGPFTYAPKTHLLGDIKTEPEFHLEGTTRRTTDEQMDKIVSKDKWIIATGKVGDVVIADTHGFHKGGLVRESERKLYTCMYTSPSCDREYFS